MYYEKVYEAWKDLLRFCINIVNDNVVNLEDIF